MAFANDSMTQREGRIARIAALPSAVRAAYRRWRIFHRTRRELMALSEREMDDLGISRRMISRLAAEAAHGK